MYSALSILLLTIVGRISCAPTLEVDANSGQHPISPYIYGMSLVDDLVFAKEIDLPFNRWGGNAVTRYNWKLDVSNHASDWFFENIPEDNKDPSKLPDGSKADVFIENTTSIGGRPMLTVPMIGWVAKDREKRCGFSVKKYGQQQQTDQWTPDCGNGLKPDGKTQVTGNDPTDTSVAVNSSFTKEWVQYLVKKYGSASGKGVLFYELDNEFDLWQSTHRDVRPKAVGTDEILKLTQEYGATIKEADPSALTLGPVGWGYLPMVTKAQGDMDFGSVYLKAMKEYDDKNHKRVLDYFDYHLYPQASGVSGDGNDANTQTLRLRSTRGLWDPNYVDESWIKDLGEGTKQIHMIPRMKQMINQYYPGTKTAITEYNWGGLKTLNGALAQADVLGIFGREGLDLAGLWGPGKSTEPWAYAYRMYRNYDGKGSKFGDQSVTAKSSDEDKVAIFAATRGNDKTLTVVVINKQPNEEVDTKIELKGVQHSGDVKVFSYSNANLNKIVESKANVQGNSVQYKFPAYSITLLEIPSK